MQTNTGERIISTYESFFGAFDFVKQFSDNTRMIQFLSYDNIIKGCRTIASLGLSKYIDSQMPSEAIMIVDSEFEVAQKLFSNALFYIVQNNIDFGIGTYIEGLRNIDPEFYKRTNKAAIYFTEPFCFPEELCEENIFLLAFFISELELNYLKEHGAEAFEEYLEECEVDVFSVNR